MNQGKDNPYQQRLIFNSPDMPQIEAESSADVEEQYEVSDIFSFAKHESYTVSELTAYIESCISEHPVLGGTLIVEGEISNAKRSSRGHVYFTLKDAGAGISGILWAGLAKNLSFELKDGLAVYITGNLEIYAPNGTYSLVARKIEPVGVGPLQLAFQQIKEKLEAEGLFLPEFKKPIPAFPKRIGIVTSRTGAVIHDMLRVIRRKNPMVDVLLAPVKVQGVGAAEEIAAGINALNNPDFNLDLLIVARGGGSFEDLFCFSEEPVVRAIFNSRLPVVTGIGHEPDYALADAVADYSASTPTAAAEVAVPDYERLILDLSHQKQQLMDEMMDIFYFYEQQFDQKAMQLTDTYHSVLEGVSQQLTGLTERLQHEFSFSFQRIEQSLSRAAAQLDAFNPLATLARGFAIVSDSEGQIVSSVKQLQVKEPFYVRLSDGQVQCEVIQKRDGKDA